MHRIRIFNKIAPEGLAQLDPAIYETGEDVRDEEGILVRSANLLDYKFPDQLLAIARAGVGVNNLPLDRCSQAGIAVFSTPGANANAVKELVLCGMLISSRDVTGAVRWVRRQAEAGADLEAVVEKGKAAFVGRSSTGNPWASSAWGPSALWSPTWPWIWAWMFTATIPSSPWTPPFGWTGTSTWSGTSLSCIKRRTTSPPTFTTTRKPAT